jgi:cell wall-associated NlpC family hydrolase
MKQGKPLTARPIVVGQPACADITRAITSPRRPRGAFATVFAVTACGLMTAAAPALAATATVHTGGPAPTVGSGPAHDYSAVGPVAHGSAVQIVNASSRADQAINWFQARFGNTSFHMRCETAVENANGTAGRHPSALENWRAAVNQGRAHPGDLHAPRGALVFWDITQPWGHVGISRGDGTFVATDVNGAAIGAAQLSHYSDTDWQTFWSRH